MGLGPRARPEPSVWEGGEPTGGRIRYQTLLLCSPVRISCSEKGRRARIRHRKALESHFSSAGQGLPQPQSPFLSLPGSWLQSFLAAVSVFVCPCLCWPRFASFRLFLSHAIALLSGHPVSLSYPLPFPCQSLQVSPPVSASLLIALHFFLQSKAFPSPSLILSCFCLSSSASTASSACSSSSFSVPPLPYHPTHLGQRIVLGSWGE